MEFGRKRSCLKRIRGYDIGEKVVEVGTRLLGNDKDNVIANKVLKYFQCLRFRDEIIIINFLLANPDLLEISIFYLFLIKHIYRNPLHND